MALSQDLVSQFAKLANSEPKQNKDTTVNGTYKIIDGKEYVQIDGSEIWTPVTSTVEAETGERVTVLLKDHTATVTGNISSPSARTKTVQNLKDEVDEHGNTIKQLDNSITQQGNSIIQINNSIKQQGDTINSFGNTIDSQNNKIQQFDNTIKQHGDSITSMNNTITQHGNQITTMNNTIESQNNTIKQQGDTIISQGNTITQQGNLISQQGNTINQHNTSIETANSNIQILNSGFKIEDGVLTGLSEIVVDELETNTLNAKYANIDFANINMAAVEKLFSDSGIIKDLIVSEGKITGELVGVTIKGDLIEGNTVKADKLVVRGEDGIYYKLNVDSLGEATASSDEKYQNGLDGSVIVANSITAEKVAVTDLVAFGATIGGFHIDDHSLYSGAKNSATNTTRGIFLSDDGQLSVGDDNNYLRYFKDTDGNYKLEISMGGSTIDDSINQAVDNKLNDIEIGGRNLILNSDKWSSKGGSNTGIAPIIENDVLKVISESGNGNWHSFVRENVIEENLKEGDTFTFSMEIKSDDGTLPPRIYFKSGLGYYNMIGSVSSEYSTVYYTGTWKDTNGISFHFGWSDAIGTYYIRKIKMEKGNKPTDWTPAPEDVEKNIDGIKTNLTNNYYNKTETNAKIKVESDRITSTVSKVTTIENNLNSLEIGGRNFLRDTTNPSYTCFTHIGTLVSDVKFNGCSVRSTNKAWDGIKFHFKTQIEDRGFVEAGDTFTYSIWARKSDEETLNIDACITADGTLNGESGSANRFISTRTTMSDYTITTEWKRFYYTFTVPPERLTAQNGSIMSFRIEQNKTSSEGCCVMWACPKLEKGNKLTDWSPAPEDANPSHYTKTETDAKIQVQSDRISSTVSKVTTVENNLNNLSIGGRNILLNSSFKENGDDWEGSGILEFVEKDGQSCAHIQQTTLGTIKTTRQSVFGKLEPNTQYTVSGWVRTDNIVRGPTNPSIMFYHDGDYVKEDGTSAWFGYLAQVFKTNTGEGSWQYLTKTFTTDDRLSAATRSEFYVYTRDVTGDIYFYNLKLEKGNKPTDWTPAPEDVEESINEANTKIENLEISEKNTTSIIQDTRNLIFTALEQYVATGDLEEYKRIVSTQFEQTAKDFTFLFENAISKVNSLDGATQAEFEKWKKYIRFVDGNIVLGKVGNEITLNLENDILYFLQNNGKVAYLSNNKLYVTDGEFIKSLTVGHFGYKPRKNGSLTFGKIKKQ